MEAGMQSAQRQLEGTLVESLQEHDVAKFKKVRSLLLRILQVDATPNRPATFDGKPMKPQSTKGELVKYMNWLAEHIHTGMVHWMTEGEIHAMYLGSVDTMSVIPSEGIAA